MTMNARRRFLRVLAAASVVAGCGDEGGAPSVGTSGGAGGAMGQPEFPEGYVLLGNVETFPVGTFKPIAQLEIIVAHDPGGVYAMTSRCTHQNCNMIGNDGTSGNGITTCGCHNSVFDPNGEVVSGPASQPLQHFACLVDADGFIAVNPSLPVGLDDRAAVV
jgi:cytochrome b6-f complex iron-sulfur subunit